MSLARTRNALTLFVGNLPWTVSKPQMLEYFKAFGKVRSVTVAFDMKTGLSKGYGFVEYSSSEGYNTAISHDHHILDNSKLAVRTTNRREGSAEDQAL